jgi:hypothetical protein
MIRMSRIALTLCSFLSVSRASAQSPISSRNAYPDECPQIVAAIRRPSRASTEDRALNQAWTCGDSGYAAVAARVARDRHSRNRQWLVRLNRVLVSSSRDQDFELMLGIAGDRTASPEARGAVLHTLYSETHRDVFPDYEGPMRGLDAHDLPVGRCAAGRGTDYGRSALTPTKRERVKSLAWQLYRDKSQPGSVRAFAYCILG